MKVIWNQKKYSELLKYLESKKDITYQEFQGNLGISKDYLIGVKTPILKKVAKEISKTDYQSFLIYNTHKTYEEILLHGLLIGYLQEDFSVVQELFWQYLPYIDNWALCDLTCSNMKIWYKYQEEGLIFVKRCLKQKNKWYQRVGFVLLLDYYVNNYYIDAILTICNNHKTEEYYVQMAMAWLLSICYLKEKEKTRAFLKENQLDAWIQNKTIQKIRESRQIGKEEKEEVLVWKKK